jgi:hypothetical protein
MNLMRGPRAYAETIFTSLLQAAFRELSYPNWDPEPARSDLDISTGTSLDEIERLPRVTVTVGDIQDFGSGSIGHLAEWGPTMQRYVYAEQAYVSITCYSSVADESSDMAFHARRCILLMRDKLRTHGIMGLQTFQQSQPQPNQMGSISDHVFATSVQAAFVFVSNDLVEQTDELEMFETWRGVGGDPVGGTVPKEGEIIFAEGPSTSQMAFVVKYGTQIVSGDGVLLRGLKPADTVSVVSTRRHSDGLAIVFSGDVDPTLPTGFKLLVGDSEISCYAVRRRGETHVIDLETDESIAGRVVRIVYDSGNLVTLPSRTSVPNFTIEDQNA